MKGHQIWWQSTQTKKVINRQTKFTSKTPPPSANRVRCARDADSDCSSPPLKLFVLNNDDAKST